MDIRDYLAAWRTNWVIVLVCTVLAVGVAAGVTAFMTPKYEATTRLFVTTTGGASVSEAYQGNLFSTERVTSYAGLAAGKQVAQRAIDELGLNASPEDVMSRVTAEAVPESVLLDITVTDRNAGLARDLANVVASQTSSLVQELETSARGGVPAASATIVDLADLPAAPSSPSWYRNLVFGLVGGLILGLVAAVVRFVLDRSVRDEKGFGSAAGAPVLGSVPRVGGAAPGKLLFASTYPAPTRAFREIRTNLLALDSDTPVRTLVVSAPRVGAGATTVAAGVSAAIAETGRSVVVVDADLADGRIGAMFGLGEGAGLSELLRGEGEIDDVVAPTEIDNLSVVVPGASDASTSGLLGGTRMADLVKQLHGYFDFVVVDSPAVLSSADTAILAGVSDGVLLVGRTGTTTDVDLADAAAKLALAKARTLGCVANGPRRRWSL